MPRTIIPFLLLNETETLRLSFDDAQWMLERGRANSSRPGKDSGYRAISFVSSEKRFLFRDIRERGLHPDLDVFGRKVLNALPDRFEGFQSLEKAYGIAMLRAEVLAQARMLPPLPEAFTQARKGPGSPVAPSSGWESPIDLAALLEARCRSQVA